MKLPIIRESYFMNIVILIFSIFISFYSLLFGLAHLFDTDFKNLDLESSVGVIFCVFLCLVGFICLGVALASIKGILYKLNKKN